MTERTNRVGIGRGMTFGRADPADRTQRSWCNEGSGARDASRRCCHTPADANSLRYHTGRCVHETDGCTRGLRVVRHNMDCGAGPSRAHPIDVRTTRPHPVSPAVTRRRRPPRLYAAGKPHASSALHSCAGMIDNVAATLGQAQRYQMLGPMLPITDQGSDKPLRFLRAEQSAHVIITSVCPRSCAMRIT